MLALLAGALLVWACGSDDGAGASERPNIVQILTDDQTLSSFSRETMPHTHDLLVDEGTNFTNGIVTTPVCCPARASYLTGQYGHNNGVLWNNYGNLFAKSNVLPSWLREAGYLTAHVGKFLNRYEDYVDDVNEVAPGWEEWHTALGPRRYFNYRLQENGETVRYDEDPDDYLTRVLNRKSVELIEEHAGGERPLYLQLDHYAPHFGWPDPTGRCTGKPVPDPIDAERFLDAPLPEDESFDEEDISDKFDQVGGLPRIDEEAEEEIRTKWGCHLAALLAVDRGIEEIVDALDEQGELDNTVFVFWSDNGYFHGEHRIPGEKHYAYEPGVRVPFVVRMPPDLAGPQAPAELDVPVSNIDLTATIVEIAGADTCRDDGECRTMDGQSLMPLLTGEIEAWNEREALGIEIGNPGTPNRPGRLCEFYGAWTPDAVYMHHETIQELDGEECGPPSSTELYDMEADPYQLQNLSGEPEARELEQRMRRLALRLADCSGVEGRDEPDPEQPFCS